MGYASKTDCLFSHASRSELASMVAGRKKDGVGERCGERDENFGMELVFYINDGRSFHIKHQVSKWKK